MKARNTSLIRAAFLYLLLIATLPNAFAQVTCPADVAFGTVIPLLF